MMRAESLPQRECRSGWMEHRPRDGRSSTGRVGRRPPASPPWDAVTILPSVHEVGLGRPFSRGWAVARQSGKASEAGMRPRACFAGRLDRMCPGLADRRGRGPGPRATGVLAHSSDCISSERGLGSRHAHQGRAAGPSSGEPADDLHPGDAATLVPSSRLLARSIRPSTAGEAASLGITPRAPVVHLRRGTGTIVAVAATTEDARLLSVRAGDPLLVERRVISDVHGRPIEAIESRYPADRYALEVRFDVEAPAVAPTRTGE